MSISDMVSDYASKYTGCLMAETAITGEAADGGNTVMRTTWGPLLAVSQVYDNVDDMEIDEDDYYVVGDDIVHGDGPWESGSRRYSLSYTAGFPSIPAGLVEAITRITAEATAIYATIGAGAFKSETNKQYSYTQFTSVERAGIIHSALLDMYRRYV